MEARDRFSNGNGEMIGTTLRRYLTQHSGVEADLIFLIEDVAAACRATADLVRNAAFDGLLGATETINVQGEVQKPLDILANDAFVRICSNSPDLAALVSEEVEEVIWLKEPRKGDYILYFDPLDGSSNLDVDLSVGSIFSIAQVGNDGSRDVLRKGIEQRGAGYAIYGPSTMLVLCIDGVVNGFSCHAATGEFRLTHPEMRVPASTREFAINASRRRHWAPAVRRYVDECVEGSDGPRGESFNMRWTASMVAEVHRILVRGGIFLYPQDAENSDAGGKLRLLYEANPMSLVIEAAGGSASTGTGRILELMPNDPHQRVPVILGSREEVSRLELYHRDSTV